MHCFTGKWVILPELFYPLGVTCQWHDHCLWNIRHRCKHLKTNIILATVLWEKYNYSHFIEKETKSWEVKQLTQNTALMSTVAVILNLSSASLTLDHTASPYIQFLKHEETCTSTKNVIFANNFYFRSLHFMRIPKCVWGFAKIWSRNIKYLQHVLQEKHVLHELLVYSKILDRTPDGAAKGDSAETLMFTNGPGFCIFPQSQKHFYSASGPPCDSFS